MKNVEFIHQSIEPPGCRGGVGDNKGIKSLLNNKVCPGGGSLD